MQNQFKDPFEKVPGAKNPTAKDPFKSPFKDPFGNDVANPHFDVRDQTSYADRTPEQIEEEKKNEYDRLMQEFMEWETQDSQRDIDRLIEHSVPQIKLEDDKSGFVLSGSQEALQSDLANTMRGYIDMHLKGMDLESQFAQEFIDSINKDIKQQVRSAVIQDAIGVPLADLESYNYAVETMIGTNPMRSHNKIGSYDKDGKLVYKTPEEWVEYWQKHYNTEERARLFFESAHNPNLYKRIPYLIMSGGRGNATAQYGFSPLEKAGAGLKQFWKDFASIEQNAAYWIGGTITNPGAQWSGRGFAEGGQKIGVKDVDSDLLPWMSQEDYVKRVEEVKNKGAAELNDADKMFLLANDKGKLHAFARGSFNFLDDNKVDEEDLQDVIDNLQKLKPNKNSYEKYLDARSGLVGSEGLKAGREELDKKGAFLLPSQEKLDLAQLYAGDFLRGGSIGGSMARFAKELALSRLVKLPMGDVGEKLADVTTKAMVKAIGATVGTEAATAIGNSFLTRFVVGLAAEIPEDIIQTAIDNTLTGHEDENAGLMSLESIGENTMQNLIMRVIWSAGHSAKSSLKSLRTIRKAAREAGASGVDFDRAVRSATDVVDAMKKGRYEGLDVDGHIKYRDSMGKQRVYSDLNATQLADVYDDAQFKHDAKIFSDRKYNEAVERTKGIDFTTKTGFTKGAGPVEYTSPLLNIANRADEVKNRVNKGGIELPGGVRLDVSAPLSIKGEKGVSLRPATNATKGMYINPAHIVDSESKAAFMRDASDSLKAANAGKGEISLSSSEKNTLKKIAAGDSVAIAKATGSPFIQEGEGFRYIQGIDRDVDASVRAQAVRGDFAKAHPEEAELLGFTGSIGADTVAMNEAYAGGADQAPTTGAEYLADQKYNSYSAKRYPDTTAALADMPSYSNLAAVQTWHQKAQDTAMADYDKNIMPKFQETYKTPEDQRAAVAKWDFMAFMLRKGKTMGDLIQKQSPDKVKVKGDLKGDADLAEHSYAIPKGKVFDSLRAKLKSPKWGLKEWTGQENLAGAFASGDITYAEAKEYWRPTAFKKLRAQVGAFVKETQGSQLVSKKDLPKIRTSDYTEATGYTYKDAPSYMKPYLSKNGRPLGVSEWIEVFPDAKGDTGEGAMRLSYDDILDRYENILANKPAEITDADCAAYFRMNPEQEEFFQKAAVQMYEDNSPLDATAISKKDLAKELKHLYDEGQRIGGREGDEILSEVRTLNRVSGGVIDIAKGEYTGASFTHDGKTYRLTAEDVAFYEDVIEPEMQLLRGASVRGLGRKNDHSIKGYLPQSNYNPTVETAEGVLDIESGTLWRKNKSKMASDDNGNFSTANLDLNLRNRLEIFANNMLWDALGDRTKIAKIAEELSADGEKVSGKDMETFLSLSRKNAEAMGDSEVGNLYKKYIDDGGSALLGTKEGTTIDLDEDVNKVVKAKEKADKKIKKEVAQGKAVDAEPKEVTFKDVLKAINDRGKEVGAAKAIKEAYSILYKDNVDVLSQPKTQAFIVESDWLREMSTRLGNLYDWGGQMLIQPEGNARFLLDQCRDRDMEDVFIDFLTQHGRRSRKGAEYIAEKWMANIASIVESGKGTPDAVLAKLSMLVRQEGMSRVKKWVASTELEQLSKGNLGRLNSLLVRHGIIDNELHSSSLMQRVDDVVNSFTSLRMKSLFYLNVRTGVLQLSETSRLFSHFKLGNSVETIARLTADSKFRGEVDFWEDVLLPEGAKLENAELSMGNLNKINVAKATGETLKKADEFLASPVEMGEHAKNYILIAGIYQEAENKGLVGQALYDYMNKKFERVALAANEMGRLGYADNPFARLALNLQSFTIREFNMYAHDVFDLTKGEDGGAGKLFGYLARVFGSKLAMAVLYAKLGYNVNDILGLDPLGLSEDEYTGLDNESKLDTFIAKNPLLNSGMTGFLSDYYFAARRAYEQDTPEEDREVFGLAPLGDDKGIEMATKTLLGFVPGFTAFNRGYQMSDMESSGMAISDAGNRMYESTDTLSDKIKGYLFGRNATEKGREYNQTPDPLRGLKEDGYLGVKRELGRISGDYRQFDPVDKENYSDWFDGSFADEAQWTSGYHYFQDKKEEIQEKYNDIANNKYSEEGRDAAAQAYQEEIEQLLIQISRFADAYMEKHAEFDGPKMRNLLSLIDTDRYDVTKGIDQNQEDSREGYNNALDLYTKMGLPQTIGYKGKTTENPRENTYVQMSPQFRAAVQGQYGLPEEAARVIEKLHNEKWKNLRKKYSEAAYADGLTFDEREYIQHEYIDEVGKDLDAIVAAYGTDIFMNDRVDDIMEDVFTGMVPYKDYMRNKKGRINPSTPYAQVDYSDWLKQTYSKYPRSGKFDYREESSYTITDIRRLLDEGKIALAKARARIVLERVRSNRAYVSRNDLDFLNSVIRR